MRDLLPPESGRYRRFVDVFAGLGDVLAYFCNPNVHPLLEFRKRLKAFEVFAKRTGIRFDADHEYGLHDFLRLVQPDGSGRCPMCYRERLRRTARYAAGAAADAFSTTLLSSTHQDHEAVRRAGEEAASESGVAFLYRDLRHLAGAGDALASKMSIYRQQYCGCIFSEYERYKNTNTELRRNGRAD